MNFLLENLKPQSVFKYFEEICKIPHGSGNTKAISDYCVNFAKSHNLEYIRDELNNVIIKKPASLGFENHKPVILQGHLDMVCEKTPGSSFDFLTDGLELYIDGDFIRAKDTTLGGDDGIAVAFILSILADNTLTHPKLEALFTTDEETGMYGAIGLDASLLSANTLINIDMEEEGVLTVGCAGGARADVKIPIEFENGKGEFYKISVTGLKGGHSGVEIDKKRINANIFLGSLLNDLQNKTNFSLAEINGGLKDNAIPREASAVVLAENDISFLENATTIRGNEIADFYNDEDYKIKVEKINFSGKTLSKNSTFNVIRFLSLCPNGIVSFSKNIEGLVETSLNLGVLKTLDNCVSFSFAVRSSKENEKTALLEEINQVATRCNATVNTHSFYPAWEYKEDSILRETMKKVYTQIYNKEPDITVIHAGLECGILGEKIDNLDAVSFGPDVFDVHTTNEHLSISSVARSYEYLLKVLENL